MNLVKPDKNHHSWRIRVRLPTGRVVQLPGENDKEATRRLGMKIETLIRAKAACEPPPPELNTWIDNMAERHARRLVELGLLPSRRTDRHKTLVQWVVQWQLVVANRSPQSERHAPQQASKVKRIVAAMETSLYAELDPDEVVETVNGFRLATSTRRSYLIAMKDFSNWLSRKLRMQNPLADMELPGQYENPEYERQPLTIDQAQKLLAHLDTFSRYRMQKTRWTAYDRKMIYWTALLTGYREGEMKRIRKACLYLDEQPPVIALKPRDTKNKNKAEVPIPSDLAAALKRYTADLEPNDLVFPFPKTSDAVVRALRRDLEGAGVPWKYPTGEVVDFHALRSTCITWWLEENKLTPRRVQQWARLSTLVLVYQYSRKLRVEDYGWLDQNKLKVVDKPVAKSA